MSFKIEEMNSDEFDLIWTEHSKRIFEDQSLIYRMRDVFSQREQENWEKLKKNLGSPIRINLALFNESEEFIGWSWGYQESPAKFYMCNSAVFPEYRRLGLYSLLLEKMLDKAIVHGFQEIYSRHVATNNAVIIPKLKAGFKITSMEISDLFGTVIHLSYHTNKKRNKVFDFRAGLIKPDQEIKDLFKI